MSAPDFREQLTGYLRDLHLPAIRRTFEERARRAEQETLSYERYLFELIELECQERREHRITRLLQGSKLPLEKTLANFQLQRLPLKAARQMTDRGPHIWCTCAIAVEVALFRSAPCPENEIVRRRTALTDTLRSVECRASEAILSSFREALPPFPLRPSLEPRVRKH